MEIRDKALLELRPQIAAARITEGMKDEEFFQNSTLRPIIKLQNDLLIEVFKHYIFKHKNVFYDLSIQKKMNYIENAIDKDQKFRNSVKGIVIGHFTLSEHKSYVLNSSSLNKRMMNLVKERYKDNLLQFENEKELLIKS